MSVSTHIARRLLTLVPVLTVVGIIIFLLGHLMPGDPAAVMAGEYATPEQVERIRQQMGLDRPLLVQFLEWAGRVLRGDFGTSFFLKMPVGMAMVGRLEPTGLLTLCSMLVAVAIGLPAGFVAAVRRNSWVDRLLMGLSLLGICIPSFWLGILLVLAFSVTLRLFPAVSYVPLQEGPLRTLRSLLMPSFALGLAHAAFLARMARSSVLDVLSEDYVRTARAKGLNDNLVSIHHVLPNVLVPVLTIIGNSVGSLMAGAITIEQVFNLPGVGRLMIQSVSRRDYPVIQGVVLGSALVYVLVNLIVDIAYGIVDPRIRQGSR